jgi:predicted RNA-binding protein with PIN domain
LRGSPKVAYLIDGNNFIGYLAPSRLKDPKTKHILISQLTIFKRLKRTKIHLVFDGPPLPDVETEKLQKISLSVIFPRMEENADQTIKRIIKKQTDLRRFFVVSSDRDIRRFAKAAGAKSLNCREFHRLLRTKLKEYRKSQEIKKEERSLSPLEVNHWSEVFKRKK